MKFRLLIELPAEPDAAAAMLAGTLMRFAQGCQLMGSIPSAPVPIWTLDGQKVGRAWTETEEAPADGPLPGL